VIASSVRSREQFGAVLLLLASAYTLPAQLADKPWSGYAHDPQHSGVSAYPAQPLNNIHWCTPVDTVLENTSGPLYIHYGTPVVTAANTVLVPQRTSANNTYQINAFNGGSGGSFECPSPNTPLYTLTTDYTPPPHNWIPSYGATLALGNKYYYPGAGGTVYYRTSPDSATGTTGQLAFYGLSTYQANTAAFNSTVMISTPITADRLGNIYFGFIVTNSNPANLQSGLARISVTGAGTWVSAAALAAGDNSVFITQVQMNCAPALRIHENVLYIALSSGDGTPGYLAAVDSATLAPIAHVHLIDPNTQQYAAVMDDGSAAPTVGPDGDVYFGVLETSMCCSNHDRGWLLHFNSTLSTNKLPGAFGWDSTASIVAKSLVPSYQGNSSYLLLTKYNNYAGTGGNGQNYVAVTDPNNSMTDPVTGVKVMNVVMEQIGPTSVLPATDGVREWCINSAAVDPFTNSAIVNSEDGINYRWDFTTNTLSQRMPLSPGVGEAYTPTVIGSDGTVYAINGAVLYAIGQ
jgi:hypothetical protein